MRPPLLFVALSAVLLGSCFSPGDGQSPPLKSLYFPTGLALDVIPKVPQDPSDEPEQPDPPKHLFVASSDFDLQYKASALASYDLVSLQAYLPQSCNVDADCADGKECDAASANHLVSGNPSYFCVAPGTEATPCGALGEHSAADQLLFPGRCASIDPRVHPEVIADQVQIGAFATDAVFKATGKGGSSAAKGRLFLPVRGDATLHWIDVLAAAPGIADGAFDCGQSAPDFSCDGLHRIGDNTDENLNNLKQEPEPFAIAVDDNGNNIAITNQTTGSVSLYVNQWADAVPIRLDYVLTGLPTAPVGIAALPAPLLPSDTLYETGFLTVYRNAPQVDLLRVHSDGNNEEHDNYQPNVLTRAAAVAINANSIGSDSRGIVIDDSQREADYRVCQKPCFGLTDAARDACLHQQTACLQAVHQPNVFVSNRAPASLLIGALTPDSSYVWGTSELPAFTDSIPLPAGPSRVVLGKVRVPGTAQSTLKDEAGRPYELEQRVFVVCFDSRRIYLYDPVRHVIDAIVSTGRGPFALAIDEARGLGYVAHFTDSYLGVISLDQRFPKNYAAIVASIGVPSPPRTSK
jgi:hypothetical protein